MYKNTVDNATIFLEIPALLYCVKGNSAEIRVGKFEKILNFFQTFSTLDILGSNDKWAGISKNVLCCSLPYFYTLNLESKTNNDRRS